MRQGRQCKYYFLLAQTVKNLPATQETWISSLGGRVPWRREWLPTVFLPGEFYGQRNLAGDSPWGHRVGHNWENGSWDEQLARRPLTTQWQSRDWHLTAGDSALPTAALLLQILLFHTSGLASDSNKGLLTGERGTPERADAGGECPLTRRGLGSNPSSVSYALWGLGS